MYPWYLYGLISNLSFGITDVFTYQLSTLKKYNSLTVNTLFHFLMTIILILFFIYKRIFNYNNFLKEFKQIFLLLKHHFFLVFFIILSVFLANSFLYYSYSLGEELSNINPGVTDSFSNLSIIISTFLAWLFFNKKIKKSQLIGIVIFFIATYFLAQ